MSCVYVFFFIDRGRWVVVFFFCSEGLLLAKSCFIVCGRGARARRGGGVTHACWHALSTPCSRSTVLRLLYYVGVNRTQLM